jgi:hypothetical protein
MKLFYSAFIASSYAYTGTCKDLPNSRISVGLINNWNTGEQPKLEIDFDNDLKSDEFALNDESYLLLHFSKPIKNYHKGLKPMYPLKRRVTIFVEIFPKILSD